MRDKHKLQFRVGGDVDLRYRLGLTHKHLGNRHGSTTCCDTFIFTLPVTDRLTQDDSMVTCKNENIGLERRRNLERFGENVSDNAMMALVLTAISYMYRHHQDASKLPESVKKWVKFQASRVGLSEGMEFGQ